MVKAGDSGFLGGCKKERVDDKCAQKLRATLGEKVGREFSWHLIRG